MVMMEVEWVILIEREIMSHSLAQSEISWISPETQMNFEIKTLGFIELIYSRFLIGKYDNI